MSKKKADDELRQLDREIAELIGWEWPPAKDPLFVSSQTPQHIAGKINDAMPYYSSTWEGFGLLVEEWEKRGWNYQVSLLGRHDELGATPAAFLCSEPGYRPFWHIERTGNDIRHAAARATRDALKAAKKE